MMITNNIILEEEKNRILEMHKNATKKHYLMEAEPVNPETTTTSSFAYQNEIIPELPKNVFKFKKGASQINQESITNWDDFVKFINGVINYLKTNKKKISNITINGSESQTPGKKDNYELAKERQNNMNNYISRLVTPEMKAKDLFGVSLHPSIGKTPYKQGVDNANDPKYLEDQWVKVWFKIEK
jgi:hypothetical protein